MVVTVMNGLQGNRGSPSVERSEQGSGEERLRFQLWLLPDLSQSQSNNNEFAALFITGKDLNEIHSD